MRLDQADLQVLYDVTDLDFPIESKRHLASLGIKLGSRIRLISKTKDNAILQIMATRLALDKSILSKILVEKAEQSPEKSLLLSELRPGQSACVAELFALEEVKRRLLDMGLTKNTKLRVEKVAPLGDPMEISLRGYALSLRKSEAQLVRVTQIEEEINDY